MGYVVERLRELQPKSVHAIPQANVVGNVVHIHEDGMELSEIEVLAGTVRISSNFGFYLWNGMVLLPQK